MIWRSSANKEITITNISPFKKRPVIGDAVSVVTLDSDIPTLSVRILRAKKQTEDPCTERPVNWWEIELEPLKERNFFEVTAPAERSAEYPFDVVIIYPAVKFARQVGKDQLKLGMLPKGVFVDTVKAAIDLNDDGAPDLVVLEYCCSDRKKPPEACEYTCGKTFKKVRNTWKLIDTFAPC